LPSTLAPIWAGFHPEVMPAPAVTAVLAKETGRRVIRLDELGAAGITSGWKTAQIGASVEGNPLTINGRTFEHGLGTHAESSYLLALDGKAQLFRAFVGVDDEVAASRGSVEFIVSGEITPYETESYTRYPPTIEGVRIVVLFYEVGEGTTRVGLRALGDVDVGRLATKHGGGGHSTAAGVVLEAAIDEAERLILSEIGEALNNNEEE